MNEKDIHNQFIKWLNMMGLMFGHERTDKRTSSVLGEPDFRIYEAGHVLFVEVKVLGNKLSEEQVKRHLQLRTAGCRVEVCFSDSECIDATRRWLEDIRRVTAVPGPLHGHPSRPLDCEGVPVLYGGKGKVDI